MGYLDIKIFITVFSISLATLSAKKIMDYESDEIIDTFNQDYTTDTEVLDLRGKLRRSLAIETFIMNADRSSICSPISALLPLGKLALGAQGRTLKELNNAIGTSFESTDEDNPSRDLKRHLKNLVKNLERLPGVVLDVVNRLYVSDKLRLHSNYSKLAKSIFKTSVKKVDFEDSNRVVESINSWVSSETHGMIPSILKRNDISRDSSLVVVNAIYFAGKWKRPFRSVSMGLFHSPDGIRNVPMMADTFAYDYHDSDVLSAQIVKIPYEREKASFLILLPWEQNGLHSLLERLREEPQLLTLAIQQLRKTKLKLTFPKFKIESEWDLVTLYKIIGVNSIFKRHKSELTGIVQNKTIYVTSAIQKAVIDVTELGTEAAAGSANVIMQVSYVVPQEFYANRPFLFYILSLNEQLFSGTYIQP